MIVIVILFLFFVAFLFIGDVSRIVSPAEKIEGHGRVKKLKSFEFASFFLSFFLLPIATHII